MKKLNAWINKFFGIGAGEDVNRFTCVNGEIPNFPTYPFMRYISFVNFNVLKDGTTVIIDRNKKTITFKMI